MGARKKKKPIVGSPSLGEGKKENVKQKKRTAGSRKKIGGRAVPQYKAKKKGSGVISEKKTKRRKEKGKIRARMEGGMT